MPLTFQEVLAIDLVPKQIDLALQWVAAEISDRLGPHLAWRSEQGAFESPLETVFDTWWFVMRQAGHIADDVALRPQQTVVVGGNRYRLDFAIEPSAERQARLADNGGGAWPLFAVELDGHEFHERTREQVTSRNQRDRDLQGAGWRVLHYSGSELVRDPAACLTDCYGTAEMAFWAVERHLFVPAEPGPGSRVNA